MSSFINHFGDNSAYLYSSIMKKKQLIFKRLKKEGVSHTKILSGIDQALPQAGIEEIANHFIKQRDHEEELQKIDGELLDIVLTRLMEDPAQESQVESQKKKIDVLTYSEGQLLAFCHEKGLISLGDYLLTRQNKTYMSHSDYGYMLVAAFPAQFEVGPRCTHYHCKTTALRIERQYGIYNTLNNDQERNDNEEHQSDEDFIKNSDSQSENFVIDVKRKVKKAKQTKVKCDESPLKQVKKKRKYMSIQQSDQEGQIGLSNHKKSKDKMHLEQQKDSKKEDALIQKAIDQLQLVQILATLDYQAIFYFLSQYHIQKLRPLIDLISETILINRKQFLREKSSKKNKKGHKRLAKMKVNLKELTLEDLVTQCLKKSIISQEEYMFWQMRYQQNDHPKLAYELLEALPDDYVIQGIFNGYPDEKLNLTQQQAYQEYQKEEIDEDEQEGSEEQEQSKFLQENQEQNGSNYSLDPDEEDLGII